MAKHMLTTVDNPFDPFIQYNEWMSYDIAMGYNSNGLLARIAITSDDLPPSMEEQAIEDAIDEIVLENVSGMHKKISNHTEILLNDKSE